MAVGGLGVSGRPFATLLLMCGVVALPRASFVSSWAPGRRYKSSTSIGEFAREQQGVNWSLAACSSGVKYVSL